MAHVRNGAGHSCSRSRSQKTSKRDGSGGISHGPHPFRYETSPSVHMAADLALSDRDDTRSPFRPPAQSVRRPCRASHRIDRKFQAPTSGRRSLDKPTTPTTHRPCPVPVPCRRPSTPAASSLALARSVRAVPAHDGDLFARWQVAHAGWVVWTRPSDGAQAGRRTRGRV
ncbi:hypothetical protein GQ55_9G228700 [Panicum hallii var. hallii]|uniref:Uncharacterized protein n=1 Tax=Panicum hallii var. hallii TaxID=1504633 RepID=A0A2T7C675_9POAL|nr:hypothetical protein GQ55_9G228700 [Panicum hallii var. hallii]